MTVVKGTCKTIPAGRSNLPGNARRLIVCHDTGIRFCPGQDSVEL
jgi:hypothetical protein